MPTAAVAGSANGFAKPIRDYLNTVVDRTGVSELSFGLSIRGTRLYYNSGKILYDSGASLEAERYSVGCVLNPLNAFIAQHFSEDGLLDLDVGIGRFFPTLLRSEKGDAVKVKHLMSHTGGYRGLVSMDAKPDARALIENVRQAPQIFSPGDVFNYEQSGPALLSAILTKTSGLSPDELIRSRVLDPLRHSLNKRSHKYSTGGSPSCQSHGRGHDQSASESTRGRILPDRLTLSMPDLLSVAELLMLGGSPHDGTDSARTTSIAMALHAQAVSIPRTARSLSSELLPIGFARGLAVYRNGFLGYDGKTSSQSIGFRIMPTKSVAFGVGINRSVPGLRRLILRGMMDRVGVPESGSAHATSSEFEVSELVGTYVGHQDLELSVRLDSTELTLEVSEKSRAVMAIHGRISSDGRLVFPDIRADTDPTFFRDPRTGDLCVMIGVCAFKRHA